MQAINMINLSNQKATICMLIIQKTFFFNANTSLSPSCYELNFFFIIWSFVLVLECFHNHHMLIVYWSNHIITSELFQKLV